MVNVLLMPSLSPTMESGIISSWQKQVGDKIEVGEVLAEIESEKVAMDWKTSDEGYLREFLAKAGDELKVGAPIAILTTTPAEDYAVELVQAKRNLAPAARP